MLSIPVTTGFLAGIAVHIITVQIPILMDFVPTAELLILRIVEILRQLPDSNMATLIIGLGVFVVSQFSEQR